MVRFSHLVDAQVNGFGGVDFSSADLTVVDVAKVSLMLEKKGTAYYVPTLVTSPVDLFVRNIEVIKTAMDEDAVSQRMIAGLHVEGPFISGEDGARGAHDKRYVASADRKVFERILDAAGPLLKLFTVAPEVPHVTDLITMASERNVVVSMGHSMASHKDIERAIDAGARCVTHLGNGIPAMLPRTDNPIFSFLSFEELTVMLITDGHHVPDPFIRTVCKTCGVDRIVVTSDAAPLAGMPPGKYVSLGGNVVLEPDGKLHIPSLGCLAGSSACLADCANHLFTHGILDEEDVVKVTRDNPAKLIGMEIRA
jgi:N-acetylglucosamine-6-phosphate deacetylase